MRAGLTPRGAWVGPVHAGVDWNGRYRSVGGVQISYSGPSRWGPEVSFGETDRPIGNGTGKSLLLRWWWGQPMWQFRVQFGGPRPWAAR